MDTRFTKGPWIIESKDDRADARGNWVHSTSSATDYLATVCLRHTISEETANAHLIAASPDLYEALADLLTAIDVVQAIPGSKGQALRKKAADALAKANGGVA